MRSLLTTVDAAFPQAVIVLGAVLVVIAVVVSVRGLLRRGRSMAATAVGLSTVWLPAMWASSIEPWLASHGWWR